MERIVIELRKETKFKLKEQAAAKQKTVKDYILWSTGLVAIENGRER